MWRDDSELTAPAIVISSLGGLVYGQDGLTPQDVERTRMLRHALKAQLGHSRPSPPRVGSCTSKECGGDMLHHRVMSTENGVARARSRNNLDSLSEERHRGTCTLSSAEVRAHGCSRAGTTVDTRISRKRGWKIKGQLAGEWRDCLGRRRRAGPTDVGGSGNIVVRPAAEPPKAEEISMAPSIPGSSSCAETKVSFEGLVDELRERLPRASLLGHHVAGQQESTHSLYPTSDPAESGRIRAIARQDEEVVRFHGVGGGGGGGGSCSDEEARRPIAGTIEVAKLCSSSDGLEQHTRGRGAAGALMPPGCLRLRHPVLGTMRATTTSQALTRVITPGGVHANLLRNSTDRLGPKHLLRQPTGSMSICERDSCRVVATGVSAGAMESSNSSPSAEMVAAAKAHERALPLLQVCAVGLVDPTGC